MINGLTLYIALLFLCSWIPAHWKRRAVGMGLVTDISVHIVLQWLFGDDAGGRIAMLFAGVLFNATMHLYRKLYGFEKLTGTGWQRFAGSRT